MSAHYYGASSAARSCALDTIRIWSSWTTLFKWQKFVPPESGLGGVLGGERIGVGVPPRALRLAPRASPFSVPVPVPFRLPFRFSLSARRLARAPYVASAGRGRGERTRAPICAPGSSRRPPPAGQPRSIWPQAASEFAFIISPSHPSFRMRTPPGAGRPGQKSHASGPKWAAHAPRGKHFRPRRAPAMRHSHSSQSAAQARAGWMLEIKFDHII